MTGSPRQRSTGVTAIVLAAGRSTRMGGDNKLLLPLGNKSLIEHVVANLLTSRTAEVVVVLGYKAERVRRILRNRPVHFVINAGFAAGMTSSIQTGVRAASAQATGYMICPGDLPWITSEEYSYLIESLQSSLEISGKAIAVPTYKGQRGNPVLFSAWFREAILSHKSQHGCKQIVRNHSHSVTEVEMQNDHILRDIDTKEAYQLEAHPAH